MFQGELLFTVRLHFHQGIIFPSPVTVQSVHKGPVVCPGVRCRLLKEGQESGGLSAPPHPPGADTPPPAQSLGVTTHHWPGGGAALHQAGPVYQADDRTIVCLLFYHELKLLFHVN